MFWVTAKMMITTARDFSTPNFIGRSFRARSLSGWLALGLVCWLAPLALAAPCDPLSYRAGVRNSEASWQLNAQQLRLLIESLRHKTGFQELGFDEAGFLTLGNRARLVGGSASARELLVAAI